MLRSFIRSALGPAAVVRAFLVCASALLPLNVGAQNNPQPILQLSSDAMDVAESTVLTGSAADERRATVALTRGTVRWRVSAESAGCERDFGAPPDHSGLAAFNTPHELQACSDRWFETRVVLPGNYHFTLTQERGTYRVSIVRATTAAAAPPRRQPPPVQCPVWSGHAVAIPVGDAFAEGQWVRDFYSGQRAQVNQGQVYITPAPESHGLVLLEAARAPAQTNTWENATVYMIMTDRFSNGDPSNDYPLGRRPDGADEIGTFHGGDIAGVIQHLDYLQALGVSAVWLTPLVEQVHGFVGGGTGDFPFYGYHGYWALDFTRLDPNFGTEEDLRALVSAAHARGIKVILDVVLNHVGYPTLADLQMQGIDVLKPGAATQLPPRWHDWTPGVGENWHSYGELIDWQSPQWDDWWGPEWVRADRPGYRRPGSGDLTMNLAGLPDFLTEDTTPKRLPPQLAGKADTGATELADATLMDYLIDWHVRWVREFGVDGFRADTVKHIELEHWVALKEAATAAHRAWHDENPQNPLPYEPFWMVAEVWAHGMFKDYYFDYGFDAIINFEYQERGGLQAAQCLPLAEPVFRAYADAVHSDPEFNGLTYLSSHDTRLFFAQYEDFALQKGAAAALLLLPGAVQIYYGDEVGRPHGAFGSDFHQGTRSPMLWELDEQREALLAHWQTLGQFRARHPAIGGGAHQKLSEQPYVFSRQTDTDAVVVAFVGYPQAQ
ncbi:alpha-amylase [Salinispirillum sp. LH 10-3-1]|uniref:Alpha-amylase n=1 Tax=Salinispirillum sp. LH 10-3-1 TaxID=2952525 RepID=A0AB38YFM4_9GAMM